MCIYNTGNQRLLDGTTHKEKRDVKMKALDLFCGLALDLFCGLGGWSDGLAAEGFDVVGVELVPMIAKLYRHKVILADCCHLPLRDGLKWDLVVGSPPCRDFSIMAVGLGHKWKRPPDPEGEGMKLVNAFLDYVRHARPRYWLMENVTRLKDYLDIKPRVETNLGEGMRRCFWGTFPAFLIPRDYGHKFHYGDRKPLRKWKRAYIPNPVSRALGNAVKTAIIKTKPLGH